MMACPKILININRPARGWYVIELLKHINAGNYSKATLARTKKANKADALANKLAKQYQCAISEG
tara:strand:+ start:543 stop:737 length:195 start_codon:yes stop_codon:yes gene_type:complete